MPRCRHCKDKFIKKYFFQPYCMEKTECIAAFNTFIQSKQKKEREKQWRVKKKEIKETNLTKSDWLNLLQKVFNTYIRIRDAQKPCISCGTDMKNRKGDASHFYPTTYSYLRFNEDNVHLSCVHCNQHKRGNLQEYLPRLILKIGQERVTELQNNRHKKSILSTDEIKEMIVIYRAKIKELK